MQRACVVVAVLVLAVGLRPASARNTDRSRTKHEQGPNPVLILDGTTVHTVGELQMHFINWGEWGSRPNTGQPYSLQPSAQWPAGSGVEYLFSGGLWIGALRNGLPAVSTAAFENEYRPRPDPRDTVYRARIGDENGNRPPSIDADDDQDGSIDEDPLDGYDNDLDGLIDEDFGAISNQMFAMRYVDNEPVSREIYPEHNPLNLAIRQESYQWDSDRFDDFIAIEYQITNIGDDILEDVYIGMFVDGDAGPRDRSNYWKDDLVAIRSLGNVCTDLGPALLSDIAYTYDADGDDGRTEGLFGLMFLGHDTHPGSRAPSSVGISSYHYFSGTQPFSLGGDPTNDFERYEIMAQTTSRAEPQFPRDFRMMVSAGPFRWLDPGETTTVQFAFVMGGSEEELYTNAASAQVLFDGAYFDLDRDPLTGIAGREHAVFGPATSVFIDSCRKQFQFETGCDVERADRIFNKPWPFVPEGDVLWINSDCERECAIKWICGYTEEDSLSFRSGVGGNESQVNWIVNTPPPSPNTRFDDHAADGVVIYWDDSSEQTRDPKTQVLDFEGYQVWRADEWARPLGTSKTTGPPTDLWSALFQMDIKNGFGEETGLDKFLYDPLTKILSKTQKRDFINTIKEHLTAYPEDEPPCPQGVDDAVCDTLQAMARYELELPGGRRYYHFTDTRVHLGRPYFFAVVAFDHGFNQAGQKALGMSGDPAGSFFYVEPKSAAQPVETFNAEEIYVVPNPVTRESLEPWSLGPTNTDPTGDKVEFRNLPRTRGTIRVYTLAGDLVESLPFDGGGGNGTVEWDLISRNGQSIASGIYLYSVDFDDDRFSRVIKKFVVIR